MKIRFTFVLLLASASGIFAADAGAARGPLAGLDANRDGVVTRAEFDRARRRDFRLLDRNRNKVISRREFYWRQHINDRDFLKLRKRRYRLMDVDDDGGITEAEYLRYGRLIFARLDRRGRGRLTAADLSTVRSVQMAEESNDPAPPARPKAAPPARPKVATPRRPTAMKPKPEAAKIAALKKPPAATPPPAPPAAEKSPPKPPETRLAHPKPPVSRGFAPTPAIPRATARKTPSAKAKPEPAMRKAPAKAEVKMASLPPPKTTAAKSTAPKSTARNPADPGRETAKARLAKKKGAKMMAALPKGDIKVIDIRTRILFASLDRNRDGAISRGELDRARRLRFRQLDANRDGALTRSEFVGARGGAAARRFQEMDRNADNILRWNEYRLAGRSRLAILDANGDGRLNVAEFAAALKR